MHILPSCQILNNEYPAFLYILPSFLYFAYLAFFFYILHILHILPFCLNITCIAFLFRYCVTWICLFRYILRILPFCYIINCISCLLDQILQRVPSYFPYTPCLRIFVNDYIQYCTLLLYLFSSFDNLLSFHPYLSLPSTIFSLFIPIFHFLLQSSLFSSLSFASFYNLLSFHPYLSLTCLFLQLHRPCHIQNLSPTSLFNPHLRGRGTI